MKEQLILKLIELILNSKESESYFQHTQDIGFKHPMLGKFCIIRTYSAGVHFGTVAYANQMEVKLENAFRLWKWENGGLSLSSIALNGMKGGRINKTGEVFLTNVIEFIPVTENFEKSYVKFIED
jgi:hypothetical protein